VYARLYNNAANDNWHRTQIVDVCLCLSRQRSHSAHFLTKDCLVNGPPKLQSSTARRMCQQSQRMHSIILIFAFIMKTKCEITNAELLFTLMFIIRKNWGGGGGGKLPHKRQLLFRWSWSRKGNLWQNRNVELPCNVFIHLCAAFSLAHVRISILKMEAARPSETMITMSLYDVTTQNLHCSQNIKYLLNLRPPREIRMARVCSFCKNCAILRQRWEWT
jgi:hypothetical protein